MSPLDIQAAADLLFGCWTAGRRIESLPISPTSRAEAYTLQATLEGRSTKPLYGWKIAATSLAGQAHIGVDGPLAGRILAERVIDVGGECRLGPNHMRVAELEFAFVMDRSLPPRERPYSIDEVLRAVRDLHPAIEIPDSRFEQFETVGEFQLIADNACAHDFLLGNPSPRHWRQLDLAVLPVVGALDGMSVETGCGRNVLGDPRIALTWLANELSMHSITLQAGQVVTTGTCISPMSITIGNHVSGDFGDLGTVTLRIV
jgi:2-keto-4-pentenoate hydratase